VCQSSRSSTSCPSANDPSTPWTVPPDTSRDPREPLLCCRMPVQRSHRPKEWFCRCGPRAPTTAHHRATPTRPTTQLRQPSSPPRAHARPRRRRPPSATASSLVARLRLGLSLTSTTKPAQWLLLITTMTSCASWCGAHGVSEGGRRSHTHRAALGVSGGDPPAVPVRSQPSRRQMFGAGHEWRSSRSRELQRVVITLRSSRWSVSRSFLRKRRGRPRPSSA
jgi:hypothetical protein